MNPFLQFHRLTKRFGAGYALKEIHLEVERGKILALLGPNGAGKSTLFGCLLGLTKPTSGRVLWQGHAFSSATRTRFGYTPERVALYPHLTVWQNALFFASLRGHDGAQMEHQLKRVGL